MDLLQFQRNQQKIL